MFANLKSCVCLVLLKYRHGQNCLYPLINKRKTQNGQRNNFNLTKIINKNSINVNQ